MMVKFGDGNHFVDRDIQPGTYTIGSAADTQTCEWGRLDYRDGVDDQVVENRRILRRRHRHRPTRR